MVFKIADIGYLKPVISYKFPLISDLRSYVLAKMVHGKIGQDEFTRAEMRDEVIH